MKIKLCGLSRPEDIHAVNTYRPDYAGFIVDFPKSHRSCTPEQALCLRAQLSPDIPAVCVTVDQPLEAVEALLRGGMDIAQLHGHEDDTYIRTLRQRTGKPVWKAFRIRSPQDLQAAKDSAADLVLLDNGYGTGQTFDWTLVRDIGRPFILAGGLTEDNLTDAANMRPIAMDVSSAAETDKRKDPEKIRNLIAIVRRLR